MGHFRLTPLASGGWVVMLIAVTVAILNAQSARRSRAQVKDLQTMLQAMNAEVEQVLVNSAPGDTGIASFREAPLPDMQPASHAWEAEIVERDAIISSLKARITELEAVATQREERRESLANRMHTWRERMREQDPEAYEQRVQEGRERLDRLAMMTRDRLEFMKAIPVDGLSPEYLENHLAVLERMEFFNEAMAKIAQDPEGNTAREMMPQMFQNLRGMGDMLVMQREVLLDDLARDIGYEGQSAREFVDAVNTITEVTTLPTPGFLRRGGAGR